LIIPRRLEEVLVVLDSTRYDRAVAAIAETGFFHVDEPLEDLSGWRSREYYLAYMMAEEALRRAEGYFKMLAEEPSYKEEVELKISTWLNGVHEVQKQHSVLLKELAEAEEELNRLRERLEVLKTFEELLKPISHIEADLKKAISSKIVSFVLGIMKGESIDEILNNVKISEDVILFWEYIDKKEALVGALGDYNKVREVVESLRDYGWLPLRLPEGLPGSPTKALEEISRERAEINSRMTEIINRIKKGRLEELKEYYSKMLVLSRALKILAYTVSRGSLRFFRGYIDVKDRDSFERILDKATDGAYTIYVLSTKRVAERKPPSKIDLPKALQPFHRVVEIYGEPEPYEVVPTIFLAITMPVIFGLMFPDLGHGLLVVLFALFFMNKMSKDFAKLSMYLGIAGMIGGLLSGEFFGPLTGKPLISLWHALGFKEPPLASPLEGDVELMYRLMSVSLWIGGFMLSLGTLLGIVDALLARDKLNAVMVKVPKFLIFLSATEPFLHHFDVRKAAHIIGEAAFSRPPHGIEQNFVLWGFLIGVLWLFIGGTIYYMKEGEGLGALRESFMEAFEIVLMVLGNIPSFLRILGLAIAHEGLMYGFTVLTYLVLGKGVIGIISGAIIYILGNLLTAGLEALIAFAHSLRLHFYEWFTKFYSGLGRPFMPITIPIRARIILGQTI
jgi:V/A-type H+-transporting ATPase subunit I